MTSTPLRPSPIASPKETAATLPPTAFAALATLQLCRDAGVELGRFGNELRAKPAAAVNAELRAQISANKDVLLEVVQHRQAAAQAEAKIRATPPPAQVASAGDLELMIRGLRRWIANNFVDKAAICGWDLEELYRIPASWRRFDLIGVAYLLRDDQLVRITELEIVVLPPGGSELKFYKRAYRR
jgi:hypothetical protein